MTLQTASFIDSWTSLKTCVKVYTISELQPKQLTHSQEGLEESNIDCSPSDPSSVCYSPSLQEGRSRKRRCELGEGKTVKWTTSVPANMFAKIMNRLLTNCAIICLRQVTQRTGSASVNEVFKLHAQHYCFAASNLRWSWRLQPRQSLDLWRCQPQAYCWARSIFRRWLCLHVNIEWLSRRHTGAICCRKLCGSSLIAIISFGDKW